jgi:thymidylate synthase
LVATAKRSAGAIVFHQSSNNIDDLMRKVFTRLLSGHRQNNRVASRKGASTEVFGVLLELTNPRARLGRSRARGKIFSPVGELLWYLSASNSLDHIRYYIDDYDQSSDDGITLSGAYGPRIFTTSRAVDAVPDDEWERIVSTLRERPGSRNAIVQIYSNVDGRADGNDIPCTCTLHFAIRKKRLHLHVHMRSNDALKGMPHDVFSFSMLQEIAARELGVEVGTYQHSVASLHLYDDTDDFKSRSMAQEYLDEGLHDIVPMPEMPAGNPWPALRLVLAAERDIRNGNVDHEPPADLDPYWKDLIILLRIYGAYKYRHGEGVEDLLGHFSHDFFRLYVLDRIARRRARGETTKDIFATDESNVDEIS